MDPSELFFVYVLLVSSTEVLASSPEIEARTAAVYGKTETVYCVSLWRR